MPGSVRQEGSAPLAARSGAAEIAMWCVVRMTMLLSAIVCVELWRERELQAPRRRGWAMSLRNFFF